MVVIKTEAIPAHIPPPAAVKKKPDRTSTVTFADLVNLFSGPPPAKLEDKLVVERDKLKEELKELVRKIEMIQNFILSNKEVASVCTEYYQKYSDYIAPVVIEVDKSIGNTIIDEITDIKLKILNYKHYISEIELFIKRHDAVYQCFLKHSEKR